jgi:hypothetical protein
MTDSQITEELLHVLNKNLPLAIPTVERIAPINTNALGWKLSRQVYEALASVGIVEPRLLTCSLANPTGADVAYLNGLHNKVMANFTQTLDTYQKHFRVIEKLNKQLVQPKANLDKVKTRFEKVEAEVKNAGDNVPEKLQGQFGAANGELKKAQQRVDAVQAQVDAEFASAAADKPAFMQARLAEEYARNLPKYEGRTHAADMVWLQHTILVTNKWNPVKLSFASVLNRYL